MDENAPRPRTPLDSLRNRVCAMETARAKLERDQETLMADIAPVINRYSEFVSTYMAKHKPRNMNLYGFWWRVSRTGVPVPTWLDRLDVTVDTEGTTNTHLQIRTEDRHDGDIQHYRVPWGLFDGTEAFLADLEKTWDERRIAKEQEQLDATRDERYAKYLELHKEFGVPPVSREEFDAKQS